MAKRFTDSRKWDDPWFTELNSKSKLAWIYLLDKCDHCGIYKPNLSLLNFQLGSKYSKDELLQEFNKRVICITQEKWFIPKYIKFQYGNIEASEGRMIKTVYNYLKDNDLLQYLNRVSTGCQQGDDTPKDKDKDKDKDKKKNIYNNNKPSIPPTLEDVTSYCSERNNDVSPEKFINHYTAKGWLIGKNKMVDWKAAIRTWEETDIVQEHKYKDVK